MTIIEKEKPVHSKLTLKNYESLENVLTMNIFHKPMSWIINNADEVIPILEKLTHEKTGKTYSDHSIKSYFKYILIWSDSNISNEDKNNIIYQKNNQMYKGYFDAYSTKILKQYETHEYTDKKKNSLISWQEFTDKRDELGKINQSKIEYLLLSMYSYIPTCRQDFDRVRIYIHPTKPTIDDKTNYIIQNNIGKMSLHLNEYKTAKIHNTIIQELPVELTNIINISLSKIPRDWLFVGQDGKPYENSNTYTRWSNRTLCKIFGKDNLTVGMLRNIRISDMPGDTPILKKILLAKGMGHTQQTQHIYIKNSDTLIKSDIIDSENIKNEEINTIIKKKIIKKKIIKNKKENNKIIKIK